MTTLSPGSSWDGTTSWSGRTPPTESSTLRGTGWPHKAIGAFNRAPYLWWADDFTVIVGAEHGDDDWIEEVQFWLEGSTATVSTVTKDSESGDIGFAVTIQPPSGTDGDAELYATIRPVNGYERLIGPLRLTLNKGVSIQRQIFYIDPAGSDLPPNDGSQALPWRSVIKACTSASSGAIIEMAAGTYLEDSNAGTLNQNSRLIEFRKAAGLDVGDVTISRTARTSNSGAWQIRAEKVLFDAITIDLGKMVQIQPANGDSVCIFKNCVLADPAGEDGPDEGYWIGSPGNEAGQILFRDAEGQRVCLLECTIVNYISTGAWLYHGCEITVSADAVFMTSATSSNGVSIWQTNANQPTQFEQRRHLETELTVQSVSFAAGKTTMSWKNSPTLSDIPAGGQPNQSLRLLSGDLQDEEFQVYSQSNSSDETVVVGDASDADEDDTARVYIIFHADSFQTADPGVMSAANMENIFEQRYKAVGANFQPWFFQRKGATGAGTVSTSGTSLTCSTDHGLVVGDVVVLTSGSELGEVRDVRSVESSTTATLEEAFSADQSSKSWAQGKSVKDVGMQLCIFDHQGSDSEVSQVQHGAVHVVVRQCTHVGTGLILRNNNTGFGLSGVVIKDSILESSSADSGYPAEGLAMDNCVFETGTVRGTNGITGNGVGTTVRMTDYKPWKNSKAANQLEDDRNYLGYDYYGDAIDTSSSNKAIGAVGKILLVNAPPA